MEMAGETGNDACVPDRFRRSGPEMKKLRSMLAPVALLATAGVMMSTSAFAQTQGTERRGERRETRDDSREEKAACKAGDEKSRPECRQDKRDTKQEGRKDEDNKSEDK
jgi:hypothetical protein